MMTLCRISLALMGLSLLSGCAAPSLKEQQARGYMIIIARSDSSLPEGRAVSDNAGGIPSAVAGATGVPMSPAGGATLNIGVALVLNLLASEANKDRVPMQFKVLYEKGCEYAIQFLDLRTTPNAEKLYPGYMARIEGDKDGVARIQPHTDNNGQQVYLTKSHPCYETWVAEWKNHEGVKKGDWFSRRHLYLFGPTPVIADPDMAWVK